MGDYVNKVIYGTSTLIDLTNDTITPETLQLGITAHDASGAAIIGTSNISNMIAYPFSESTTYNVGDLVIYNNALYCFTSAHNAGSWNSSEVSSVTVAEELDKKSDIGHIHDDRYYTETEIDTKLAPMYGYCETAADTVAKTVTINNFTLVTGRTIFVKFKYANTASNPTLNVNSTGAIPLYRYGTTAVSKTAATNSWQANSVIALTYDGTGWIEHLWQNTQYNMANNSLGGGNFTANSVVYRYQMLVHIDRETLSPFNNDNNVTATTKTILTNIEFDPFSQIYYYDSTTIVDANALISAGSIYYSRSGFDLRYSFNINDETSPLTLHKDVYMKVIPLLNRKVKLASAMPLVQELPTSNDGYWYIFLGRASGAYNVSLYTDKPVFYHDGVGLRQKFNPYMEHALNENAIQGTASGGIVSFDDGIESPVIDLKVAIEPIQEGTGDPSPENIRPIKGWTGMNVQRTRINIWDEEWEVGTISDATGQNTNYQGIRTKNYINVKPNHSYFLYLNHTNGSTAMRTRWYDINKNYIGNSPAISYNKSFTVPSNAYYLRFCPQSSYGETYLNDISVNYPATDTAYHAYTGTTYPISWETEAGTVYGGSLDVTTGLLTVDWRSITLTGAEEEGWTIGKTGTANWYYITKSGILTALAKNNSDNIKTNLYPWANVVNASTDNGSWGSTGVGAVRVRWGTEDTIANWKSFLASNPLHVVYKTLEPLTYQLTPTEVTTLLGLNRIWADTGNVDVTYVRNTNNGKIITNINNNIKSILNWFGLTYYNNGIYVNPDQGV